MRHRLSILVAVGLLAACGGSDSGDATRSTPSSTETSDGAGTTIGQGDSGSDATTSTTGEPADTAQPADTSDSGNDDGATIVVGSLDDVPAECRELMATFLRAVEPLVSGIDWQTATIEDLQAIEADLAPTTEEMDQAMANSDCDKYEFGGDTADSFDLAIELAQSEAPGTVGWLEFFRSFADAFDPTADGSAGNTDLPQDCDGLVAYLRNLMTQTDSVMELPAAELANVSSIAMSMSSECQAEFAALYNDPAFAAWFDG
jgi:hypothetical protein